MKKSQLISLSKMNKASVWNLMILIFIAAVLGPASAHAGPKVSPPEVADVIIIGDRVVDIAFNLGVMPKAMSVRGAMWPLAKKLKTVSQMLGCPNCVTRKRHIVSDACKKFDVKRLIIEKSDPYCLYKPKVKPENVVPFMAGQNVAIDYVDFSGGLESAIRRTARLLGKENRANAVIEKYNRALTAALAGLPAEKSGKKVIILYGTYQPSTGKTMLRVEAPGGYADRFLLKKIGCTNAGDAFKPASGKAAKGHYPVRKKKGDMVLDPLIKADPDIIVMTGDAFAVQKALADFRRHHPELGKVKAFGNMALYALPAYIDSSVLEYPGILKKWTAALAH